MAPVALDQPVIVSHEGRMFADLLEAHTAIGHGKAKAFREFPAAYVCMNLYELSARP